MSFIFNNSGRLGSKYWINSANKTFLELVKDSKLIPQFANSALLKNMGYENKMLVPVNPYVEYFYTKPELIEIDNGIILRQKTHAEIWVEYKKEGLYLLDKCWQRQFYPSHNTDENILLYKFYIPWIINFNCSVEIKQCSDIFNIDTQSIIFNKINFNDNIFNTSFIDFSVNSIGKHMKADHYGIIEIGTEMYDMIIKDKKIIGEILKQYE
jgi:hypothetical protein